MNTVAAPNTTEPKITDGLSIYVEPSGGGYRSQPGDIRLKYLKSVKWTDPDSNEIKETLIATDVVRRLQEWPPDGGAPISTRVIPPGEAWPDIGEMNNACRDRWYEKFGKLTGPYVGEHVVTLINPASLETYWWPSPVNTIGACIAVRALVTATQHVREFRGERVFPRVRLSHVHMPTSYGGLERPHLEILDFVTIEKIDGKIVMHAVEGISLKEETKDSIPY